MFKKILLGIIVVVVGGVFFIKWRMDHEVMQAAAIPMTIEDVDLSTWVDSDFVPKRLPALNEPQHPFLSPGDTSGMHAGGYASDVHPAAAIFSDSPDVRSRRAGGKIPRQCATFTFTSEGYPLILCGGLTSFRLNLLDPEDLSLLALLDLPMRPSTFEAMVKKDFGIIFADTSGGAYFYLDNEDRVVLADSKQRIRRIKSVQSSSGKWSLIETDSWDMNAYVPNDCFHYNNWNPKGECDAITTVMPDFSGLIWWVTRNGRIGTLNPDNGDVEVTDLGGEEIQNSFALDQDGIYIVSDHAMYGLRAANGMPEIVWRIAYDRGTGRKVGSINQGSGTTPTLLGEDYVTFTDNADDRIQIIVVRRDMEANGEDRVICRVPVFANGASATDNSMVGYGRSIILENNFGYTNAEIHENWGGVKGGVVRVDVREDESGCDIIWTSDLVVPSVVPKLSLGNGIAYFYTFDLLEDGDRLWSLVGLDFETGKEVIRVPTGTGIGYNNNWASISIAPNGDTYVGARRGLIQIRL